MKLYHGSQNGNLKELKTNFKTARENEEGKVFLTDSYACAFMYGACSSRFYSYDKENDVLVIQEKAPNGLKKMYSGHGCFIYSVDVKNAEKYENHPIKNHVYIVKENVKLDNKERIEDCYQKLLELEKEKALKIVRWEDLSEEEQKRCKNNFINNFKPYMKIEKQKFPEEYKLLVSLYKELEVEDD